MNKYVEPNLRRAAVITIDTQNDVSLPGAAMEIKGTYDVLSNMSTILNACREAHVPIIHVIRLYKEDGSNVDLCRKELIESGFSLLRPGTNGAELVATILPDDAPGLDVEELLVGEFQRLGGHEWVMYKPRWGAFYQTRLEQFQRNNGIDTLIFIGCNFPNCPRTSIYEASERDFRIVMVEDAVSGVYEKGLDEIRNIGVTVMRTDEFVERLQNSMAG